MDFNSITEQGYNLQPHLNIHKDYCFCLLSELCGAVS